MTDPTGLGRQFAATLSTAPTASRLEVVVWTTRAPTLWQLEEELGWAVPSTVRRILTTSPPRPYLRTHAVSGWLPDEAIQTAAYRPWRVSQVRRGTAVPVSYGRLLHDEHPPREWRSGDLRAEVLLDEPDTDPAVATFRYRIHQHDRIMFAGLYQPFDGDTDAADAADDVEVQAEAALRVALRSPVIRVATDPGLSDRQPMSSTRTDNRPDASAPYASLRCVTVDPDPKISCGRNGTGSAPEMPFSAAPRSSEGVIATEKPLCHSSFGLVGRVGLEPTTGGL
ncbi:hypothetical protein [Pseudofrankia sp. BMG5.36]|uniref:hypothetical protein n=1 Tax=Pseudofrankia sp. BMG5.36 TaxID=1834512 RepID=UPI0008D95C60|nr:hypothetical protein [Pseudofrankia sp. BMG5.36]OHV56972.1 hypothetical protein BCD48_43515 [Pseudofrankia sp. BMG5.36]